MEEVERGYDGQAAHAAERGRHLGRPSQHHGPRGGDRRGDPAAHSGSRGSTRCSDEPDEAVMGRPLTIVALLALAGCAPHPPTALHKGAAYLWSRQEADGGWHSHTYGLL